ncbi:serine/threonine protein kinase [Sphaeroforma arctica JP610]|uniref:Serine/threonine protein kinase n=1 Tax=Sphaeroforma arctica JP610 TaxID=667725 RepID=A0A0L0GFL5_9EUKA|nr:serine/threonine protein kinase [Sphaeroforma arctica JP610]KNC87875.1 serine/threonine protein kinase [Sphaeroforma arctica JP610]|eukprot:XP_014161777.1 serine/threonine protein kinase [Sphaeroforma arctica JP610]
MFDNTQSENACSVFTFDNVDKAIWNLEYNTMASNKRLHDVASATTIDTEAITPTLPPMTGRTYQTPSTRYNCIKPIQQGSTCIVSIAEDVIDKTFVALKKSSWAYRSQMKHEYNVLSAIGLHRNLPIVHDYIEDTMNREVIMAMDLYDGGDIVDQIASGKGGIDELQCIQHAFDLTDVFAHMHSMGFAHRDIKADNLCTTKEGTVVVIDFGEAQSVHEPIECYKKGTLPYVSCELLEADRLIQRGLHQTDLQEVDLLASDVWSLGITIYAMLTSKLPFKAATLDVRGFAEYSKGEAVLGPKDIWRTLSTNAKTLLSAMCAVDPAERCTMQEANKFLGEWLALVDSAALC